MVILQTSSASASASVGTSASAENLYYKIYISCSRHFLSHPGIELLTTFGNRSLNFLLGKI